MPNGYPMIITYAGYAQLQKHKGLHDITHFGVSDQKGELDPRRTTTKPLKYKGEVQISEIQDEHTVKYLGIIPAGLEPFRVKEVYLFLDDGTLFAIGHPRVEIKNPDGSITLADYFFYTGITEKPIELGVALANITKLLALKHVPMDEFEQSLNLLSGFSVLGKALLENTQRISILEGYLNEAEENLKNQKNEIQFLKKQLDELKVDINQIKLLIIQGYAQISRAILDLSAKISLLEGGR